MKPHLTARVRMADDPGFSINESRGRSSQDGASLTAHDMASWRPTIRSADSDILPELRRLQGRSRDLDRNAPIAHGARRTVTDNVVGTGILLSARPDYLALGQTKEWAVEWAQKMRSLFCGWWWSTAVDAADTLNGDQLATLVLGGCVMNGGGLALPLWLPERKDGYATKLQLVEIDRLSNPAGRPDGLYIRGGIEIDDYRMPVAYNIQAAHPGDYFLGADATLRYQWARIPARTDFGRRRVVHVFDPERAEQTRGKPFLSSIIPHIKQIDRYTRAELDAAVNNAMVAGIIETPLEQESIIDLFSKDSKAYLLARQEHAVRLEGGALLPLFPGDKFTSHTPTRPAAQFGAFCENIFRIAGCAIDMPYELLVKDFSKTTYTSGRMALLEAWRSFNRRRDWLGTMFLDPVYELFAQEVVYAGLIDAPGFEDPIKRRAYLRCKWIGPGRGWVDPVKEADGAASRMNAQVSCLEDECAEQGKDWREILDQIAVENSERTRLGLPLVQPTTVRATIAETPEDTAAAGGAGASPPPAEQPQQGAA